MEDYATNHSCENCMLRFKQLSALACVMGDYGLDKTDRET